MKGLENNMRTWEDFKRNSKSFTNMTEKEGNLIDTLAFLHATRIKMNILQTQLGQKNWYVSTTSCKIRKSCCATNFSKFKKICCWSWL